MIRSKSIAGFLQFAVFENPIRRAKGMRTEIRCCFRSARAYPRCDLLYNSAKSDPYPLWLYYSLRISAFDEVPGRRLQLPVQPVAAIAGRAPPGPQGRLPTGGCCPGCRNRKVFALDREDDPEPAGGRSGEPGLVTDVRAGVPPEPGRHHPDGSIPGRDSISIITLKGNITQYR